MQQESFKGVNLVTFQVCPENTTKLLHIEIKTVGKNLHFWKSGKIGFCILG